MWKPRNVKNFQQCRGWDKVWAVSLLESSVVTDPTNILIWDYVSWKNCKRLNFFGSHSVCGTLLQLQETNTDFDISFPQYITHSWKAESEMDIYWQVADVPGQTKGVRGDQKRKWTLMQSQQKASPESTCTLRQNDI